MLMTAFYLHDIFEALYVCLTLWYLVLVHKLRFLFSFVSDLWVKDINGSCVVCGVWLKQLAKKTIFLSTSLFCQRLCNARTTLISDVDDPDFLFCLVVNYLIYALFYITYIKIGLIFYSVYMFFTFCFFKMYLKSTLFCVPTSWQAQLFGKEMQ